jgi:hypothetical protein
MPQYQPRVPRDSKEPAKRPFIEPTTQEPLGTNNTFLRTHQIDSVVVLDQSDASSTVKKLELVVKPSGRIHL